VGAVKFLGYILDTVEIERVLFNIVALNVEYTVFILRIMPRGCSDEPICHQHSNASKRNNIPILRNGANFGLLVPRFWLL